MAKGSTKATKAAKSSKSTKGWFGGEGGSSSDLSSAYGEDLQSPITIGLTDRPLAVQARTGSSSCRAACTPLRTCPST